MDKTGIDKRIRGNLIRLRRNAGISQDFLARQSGVSHVSQIEAGRKPVGKAVLIKLAVALGVDISEFFRRDINMPREGAWAMLHDLYKNCSYRSRCLIEEIVMTIARADHDWENEEDKDEI